MLGLPFSLFLEGRRMVSNPSFVGCVDAKIPKSKQLSRKDSSSLVTKGQAKID